MTEISRPLGDDTKPTSQSAGMYQVIMLAISFSILQIGFGIVTPIFPYYIVELGAHATELGILAASFALTRILLAGPFGGLSDRIGRKPVIIFALLGFAIANVIYAFAPTILVMIFARSIEGAVSAGYYPAANAFVSDVTSIENRGTAMGYLSMGNMVGFVIGPTLGGVLTQFLGIRLPFLVAAASAIGTMGAVFVLVREPERKEHTDALDMKNSISLYAVFSRERNAYAALGIAMFSNMFAIGVLEVAFMLDAITRFGIEPLEIGIFFGVLGVITIVGNIGFGKLSDEKGRKWLIVFGCIFGGFSLYLFIIASELVGFYLAGGVLGLAISMRGPTIQAQVADLTDDKYYGSVMGAFGIVSNSAYVIGPVMAGILFDSSGNSVLSLSLGVLVSIIGAIVVAVALRTKTGSSS